MTWLLDTAFSKAIACTLQLQENGINWYIANPAQICTDCLHEAEFTQRNTLLFTDWCCLERVGGKRSGTELLRARTLISPVSYRAASLAASGALGDKHMEEMWHWGGLCLQRGADQDMRISQLSRISRCLAAQLELLHEPKGWPDIPARKREKKTPNSRIIEKNLTL